MKNHLPASKRITAMLCSLFLLAAVFVSEVSAQVDTAFWFAVPYVNVHHGINIVQNKGDFFGGADPLYFKISTLDVDDADVEITMPAHGDTVLFSKHIPKGSTVTYTIPRELRFKIMQDRLGDKIEDKGIYIKSNAFITVYYENATVQNPDLFSLKGKNALGKIFFTPFQTRWPNDPRHNTNFMSPLDQYWPNADGVPTSYTKINKDLNTDGRVQLTNYDSIPGVYFTVDSAYSAFDIVATEDGTIVRITPTSAVFGHAAGVPYEITLNKGQTYSARAMSQGIKDFHLDKAQSLSQLKPHQNLL